ncbi:MAG: hypothetical protein J6P82_02055 [Bacteroidales bacterium]|nr:hypothetical protein [Bacteroidales bacterium]MBO7604175.1 hypothetical protein [Bacteroidales bacterium]MBP5521384.1 hypothetical protein [Bacteroidales bacterium]
MKKFVLFLAATAFMFAACTPKDPDTPDGPDGPDDPEEQVAITIDGNFDDWAALDASKVAVAKNDPNSPWDAVKQMRVYANPDFVFYYFEIDNAQVKELLESAVGTYINSEGKESPNTLNMRINLNTDGEFTSGYENYHLQCYDFIIEGTLAQDGKWDTFADATLHQRINKKWVTIMNGGQGLTMGAGNGNKFEIMLTRELFNNAAAGSSEPKPMGDIFQTGLRFYGAEWSELSNLPNAAITDDNAQGWGNMLEIVTDK